MVVIHPGSFKRGDRKIRIPQGKRVDQRIRIPRHFAIGKYEVTFAEYDEFAQATGRNLPNDNGWGRGQRPVINVSWQDAQDYAAWLSEQTGKGYRLPNEAEWEYAARSRGKDEKYAGTSEESQLGNYAVYKENSGNKTANVSSKQPNELGLYDMSGNVYEWVEDCWHANFQGAPTDGTAWLIANGGDCSERVVRGGHWGGRTFLLEIPSRLFDGSDRRSNLIGFRLAQDLD